MANRRVSFAYYLDEDPFFSLAVELAVEDLFPRAEVELAAGDGDDRFAAHDRPLQVGVGIVLAGKVVFVLVYAVWGEFLKPRAEIAVQAALIVIDKDGARDMHGVDEAQTLFYAALLHRFFDLRGDI